MAKHSYTLYGMPFYGKVHTHPNFAGAWMEERLPSGKIIQVQLMPVLVTTEKPVTS